jgi:hypothetical protein
MPRYLISFEDGAMSHIPEDEFAAVALASHAVVHQARDAGVWRHGGGIYSHAEVSVVDIDGTVTDDAYPGRKQPVGGFAVVDVPSRADALEWAGKIAVGCRCAQEVRELVDDPDA